MHVSNGTLGCVFVDRLDPRGGLVGLSNAHVLCADSATVAFAAGDVVDQPAPSTFPPPERERLGVLRRWHIPDKPGFIPAVLSAAPYGDIDAAVCSVVRAATPAEVLQVGGLSDVAFATLGERVARRGATTGITYGRVVGLLGTQLVYSKPPDGRQLWWMSGQIRIEVDRGRTPAGVFLAAGDSGSVAVNDAGQVVGLLWGGNDSGTFGWATDMFAVTLALDITLR